ncbi:hypothetical protein OROMI_019119 [Orobanche minor]
MSVILIPMLCILGAGLLFLSYLTIGKYRSRRGYAESMETSNFVDENHGPVLDHPIWHIRTVGLPQSTIDSISTFRYEKGEGLIETSTCSICLSEFQEDESLRLLPKCSHAFHVNCIDTWLGSHVNCPICRAPVLINNVGGLSLVGSGSINSVIMEENRDSELEIRHDVRGGNETGMENQLADILSKNEFFKNRKFRVISDLSDHRVKLDRESERGGVRRSVSMDLSGASNGLCTNKGEECSAVEIVEKRYSDMMPNSRIFRLIKSTSSGR